MSHPAKHLPTKPHLDTSNAEHILFDYEMLTIAILGGIRTDILDRMRVTLKIKVEHLSFRHNLDLYNSLQVDKLVRMVAERLEIGTVIISTALMELIDLLEAYRLEERERTMSSDSQENRKLLSEQEIKEAKAYLSAPNLMERTRSDIGLSGVIGEEDNRLLLYLIFSSRKRSNPLHAICLGSSGNGKTHLQEKVAELIPSEDRIEITTLSENAFYYFGKQQLRHKLVLIEDLDGAENVLYPLREIKSKKKITKTVVIKNTKGETRTVSLVVEGPVCVSGCTTQESLYEDNANRSFLVHVDESSSQDELIMAYQRRLAAGKVDLMVEEGIRQRFRNMQRVLQPVTVRNPYAEYLQIPSEVFKPRRTNAHYLAFIEVVTFYHQYQRDRVVDVETGEEYINTTVEDIEEANTLMKEVLLRKSDQLNGATRDYFERLKQWLKAERLDAFTNLSARHALQVKSSNQKRYMVALREWGLVRKVKGDQKNGFKYEVTTYEDQQKRDQRIASILDQVVKQIKQSKVVHNLQ